MADVHSSEIRSFNMSQIKAKNTKPELLVRKFLHSKGYRFRIHDKKLPGSPDIVLKKHGIIIFVHGCFWHGHDNCKYFKIPATRTEWWTEKIRKNKEIDAKNQHLLKKSKWVVHTIWTCELKSSTIDLILGKLIARLEEQKKTPL